MLKNSESAMAVDMDLNEGLDANRMGELGLMWQVFSDTTNTMIRTQQLNNSFNNFNAAVNVLLEYGLENLVESYFLQVLEEMCKEVHISTFWKHFEKYLTFNISQENTEDEKKLIDQWVEDTLFISLEEICLAKRFQEKCLDILYNAFQLSLGSLSSNSIKIKDNFSRLHSHYQKMLSALLLTSLPQHFPDVLNLFFKARLEEFTATTELKNKELNEGDDADGSKMELGNNGSSVSSDGMDVDDLPNQSCGVIDKIWITKVGHVVQNLKELGFTAMTEDAYSTAIFSLLNGKVHSLAGEDHLVSVLEPIRNWIQVVPLCFLQIILPHLLPPTHNAEEIKSANASPLASGPVSAIVGRENIRERLTRWHLRLEYFAYETLQDLRIGQLFDIIVDYPDSEDALKDLKQCLDNTGQHAKLVDSFLSALRYRLLIAGASTNDILEQYISTIKALRILDPTGVFLEAVGKPIGEYLRGRKDASKCVVAMLTESSGGANSSGDLNEGISLLEELSRDATNQEGIDSSDYSNMDDEKAWSASQCWEPDPVEANPLMTSKSRRSADILGMLVGIFGSKEQLINEYCSMLAEKLHSKIDYNVEHETRTLELFKILFGEGSMQRCEIMINDLIASKRTNSNIKTTLKQKNNSNKTGETGLELDILDATIISECFWPPCQAEDIKVPSEVDQLLEDYAEQYHVLKAPRKIHWKKNLGTVKLELQFEDRSAEFVVSPVHATIIMLFQEKQSWKAKDLAEAVGISVDSLCRRVMLWVNQGILMESSGMLSDEHVYTIVESIGDASNEMDVGAAGSTFLEEEGLEDEQLQTKNMVVYEYFVKGMLTNFPTLKLEEIHKRLSDHSHGFYVFDLSLHQLQLFLSRLVSEDKLEVNDGEYRLRKQ